MTATNTTNTDKDLAAICERLENVEIEFREAREVHKEARGGILEEAKNRGYSQVGIARHVKKRLETDKQRSRRIEAEEAEEEVATKLGQLADTDLGRAVIHRIRAVG